MSSSPAGKIPRQHAPNRRGSLSRTHAAKPSESHRGIASVHRQLRAGHERTRVGRQEQDAAKFYAEMGPREIVLTHKDGLLVYGDGKFHEMNFYPQRLDGRSGRGDTCVGTYVAKRLSLDPREAGIWAAAVTSLKMENLGPFNRSIHEVEALIHARYNHGSIL